jgi:hypothetical protein
MPSKRDSYPVFTNKIRDKIRKCSQYCQCMIEKAYTIVYSLDRCARVRTTVLLLCQRLLDFQIDRVNPSLHAGSEKVKPDDSGIEVNCVTSMGSISRQIPAVRRLVSEPITFMASRTNYLHNALPKTGNRTSDEL